MSSTSTSNIKEQFREAEIAVAATRLIVGGALWCFALGIVDRTRGSSSDPFVANSRLALWLFLLEMLVGMYYVRYTAPTSFPILKRAAFVLSETLSQAWQIALYVVLNLTFRWFLVVLATGFAVYLVGNSWLTRIAGVAPSIGFLAAWFAGFASVGVPPVIRGTHIGSYLEARNRAAALIVALKLTLTDRYLDRGFAAQTLSDIQILLFALGGVMLPGVLLEPHWLILGTTGSGKTLCIRMILRSAFMRFGEFRNRGIIHDAKREYIPSLIGMGVPRDRIIITNPADARCSAWSIAEDIKNRDDAVNIVTILIPDDPKGSDNQFFILAARSIVVAAAMCLHSLAPGKWRLIDLVNALKTPDLIRRVLNTTKEGSEVYARYFTQAVETVGSLISTLDARFISTYENIARVWARCDTSFSLTSWVRGQSILLIGYDANSVGVERINQSIFQRAAQLVCSLPEDPAAQNGETWVVLDETNFAGELPMQTQLASFGRTKGTHMIIAPQDVDGLYKSLGEHKANELLSLCRNIGILGLSSPKTCEWASKLVGEYEAWEQETTKGWSVTYAKEGSSSYSESTATRRVKREAVLPSEFFNLPPTNRVNGLHGFFAVPCMGVWRAEIPAAFIDQNLAPIDPEAIAFIPRSTSAVDGMPWTTDEEQRFTRPFTGPTGGNPPPPKTDKKSRPNEGGKTEKPDSDGENGSDSLPKW